MRPTFRPIEPGDGDALHAVFTEPGVRQYLFDDILLSRDETRAHVEAACAHGAWAICLDGAVVGLASLRPTGVSDRELIIAVSERCWGRGVAYEAAQAALHHGFEALNLRRVLAGVDLPNQRSHRLMARLGFVAIGDCDGPKYRARHYELVRPAGPSPCQGMA
ncbi:GNAT family N-acetyltransferase [Reyranella sp.]|uniref:GNAT family N-acetyltransferase n=1 Tax=Reyranella sp. TaxID=1929291 RepID=UPI0037837B37